jgi:hypothetical protein
LKHNQLIGRRQALNYQAVFCKISKII